MWRIPYCLLTDALDAQTLNLARGGARALAALCAGAFKDGVRSPFRQSLQTALSVTPRLLAYAAARALQPQPDRTAPPNIARQVAASRAPHLALATALADLNACASKLDPEAGGRRGSLVRNFFASGLGRDAAPGPVAVGEPVDRAAAECLCGGCAIDDCRGKSRVPRARRAVGGAGSLCFVAGPLRVTVEEFAICARSTASFIRNVEAIAGGPMGGVRAKAEQRNTPQEINQCVGCRRRRSRRFGG